MKKLLTFFIAGATIAALSGAFTACNDSNGQNLSDEQQRIELAKLTDKIYYVAGFHAGPGMVARHDDGTFTSGAYLFISENLRDTVSVYNRTNDGQPGTLFDGVFEFPAEFAQGIVQGFILFPQEYRYSYCVKINSHRPLRENETLSTDEGVNFFHMLSTISANKSIVVESLSKIEQP